MIVLNYQDRRPLYEQIAEKFQVLIVKGILTTDEQMPSVRKLAVELSINPNTIQRAYSLLETQGYIYAVKGRGNFVAPEHSFIDGRRKTFFQDYHALIVQGIDMGISADELINYVKRTAEEGIR